MLKCHFWCYSILSGVSIRISLLALVSFYCQYHSIISSIDIITGIIWNKSSCQSVWGYPGLLCCLWLLASWHYFQHWEKPDNQQCGNWHDIFISAVTIVSISWHHCWPCLKHKWISVNNCLSDFDVYLCRQSAWYCCHYYHSINGNIALASWYLTQSKVPSLWHIDITGIIKSTVVS